MMNIEQLLRTYPRERGILPEAYQKIYTKHYLENREGETKASNLSKKMEYWLHRMVAKTAAQNKKTLEIGAGTLNQLDFERADIYDVVEPYQELYEKSPNKVFIRNIYSDITEVKDEMYDRIISVACFEHVENLPAMIRSCVLLLERGGGYCVFPFRMKESSSGSLLIQ